MYCSAQLNVRVEFRSFGRGEGGREEDWGCEVVSQRSEEAGTEKVVRCHWQKRP